MEEIQWFEIRDSGIHGRGAFALREIPKGTRICEYTGERITPGEADRRYDEDAVENPHTFLFTIDKKTVIDAAFGGNDSRFINHSCAPNCESLIEDKRVYIETLRDIHAGEELTYDYHLERRGDLPSDWQERYKCRCGAPNCRGTLIEGPKKRKKKKE